MTAANRNSSESSRLLTACRRPSFRRLPARRAHRSKRCALLYSIHAFTHVHAPRRRPASALAPRSTPHRAHRRDRAGADARAASAASRRPDAERDADRARRDRGRDRGRARRRPRASGDRHRASRPRLEAGALTALARRIDGAFARAVDLLFACRGRVVVTGIGKSGHVARKIAATLASTGTPAFFVHAAEARPRRPRHDHRGRRAWSRSRIPARPTSCSRSCRSSSATGTKLIAITGRPESSLAQAGRRPPRRARRRRGVPAEPRADGQHDRRARARRRARGRAARAPRLRRRATSRARTRAARSAGAC